MVFMSPTYSVDYSQISTDVQFVFPILCRQLIRTDHFFPCLC